MEFIAYVILWFVAACLIGRLISTPDPGDDYEW